MENGITFVAGIVIVALTYYLTKIREREAEWRKEKLGHYKEYLSALSGLTGERPSVEAYGQYKAAFNTVGLFASQDVIERLHSFQEISRMPAAAKDSEEHDKRLTSLILAIRQDLKLKPADNVDTFSFHLISRGGKVPTQKR